MQQTQKPPMEKQVDNDYKRAQWLKTHHGRATDGAKKNFSIVSSRLLHIHNTANLIQYTPKRKPIKSSLKILLHSLE